MAPPPARRWALLVLAVLLVTGLSGCFEKRAAEDDTASRPWFTRPDASTRPIPIGEYERYYDVDTPPTCDGCIPLDPVAETPTRRSLPNVTIPFPRDGDQATVSGGTRALHADFDQWGPEPTVPTDREGFYGFTLRVAAAGDDVATFTLAVPHGRWSTPGHTLEAQEVVWNVSLRARAVTDGVVLGSVHAADGLREEPLRGTVAVHPAEETLFWLGSHVWGRTLREGDRFLAETRLEGTGEAALRFEYHVLVAAPDAGQRTRAMATGHHDPAAPPGRLDVELAAVVTDAGGNTRVYALRFDASSPYPLEVDLVRDRTFDGHDLRLPSIGHRQDVTLLTRGDEVIPWPAHIGGGHGAGHRDEAFYLGERLAPEALDTLPRYPFRTALQDLADHESSYADYVALRPQRVVLQASYVVDRQPGGWERHTWLVVFTDRAGHTEGWRVARAGVEAVLTPVPVAQQRIGAPWDPVIDRLEAARTIAPRLGTGALAVSTLEDLGVTAVDRLDYRLTLRGADGFGATLVASRHHLPLAPYLPVPPLAYVVEDLATRRIVAVGALEPIAS